MSLTEIGRNRPWTALCPMLAIALALAGPVLAESYGDGAAADATLGAGTSMGSGAFAAGAVFTVLATASSVTAIGLGAATNDDLWTIGYMMGGATWLFQLVGNSLLLDTQTRCNRSLVSMGSGRSIGPLVTGGVFLGILLAQSAAFAVVGPLWAGDMGRGTPVAWYAAIAVDLCITSAIAIGGARRARRLVGEVASGGTAVVMPWAAPVQGGVAAGMAVAY